MMLKNVRLSFPAIFKKAEFDGVQTKFEATALIKKDEQADLIAQVQSHIKSLLDNKFGEGKAPKSIKITCFQDGDTKDYDGYEGVMALKATSKKRPTVIDKDKTPLAEDDGKPYAGCYVNMIVDFWYSEHPVGGKQVLANLYGVQFFKDGEPFGSGDVDVTDDFDAFDDDDFI